MSDWLEQAVAKMQSPREFRDFPMGQAQALSSIAEDTEIQTMLLASIAQSLETFATLARQGVFDR